MEFSSSDINEAKKRVQQMQERAKSFTEHKSSQENNKKEEKQKESESSSNNAFGLFDILGDLTSENDSSKGLILALILILAREKADNMLILALLYILL